MPFDICLAILTFFNIGTTPLKMQFPRNSLRWMRYSYNYMGQGGSEPKIVWLSSSCPIQYVLDEERMTIIDDLKIDSSLILFICIRN